MFAGCFVNRAYTVQFAELCSRQGNFCSYFESDTVR